MMGSVRHLRKSPAAGPELGQPIMVQGAPPHGFKRGLASANSAIARILCGAPTSG
jgi:hypothetical protein